MRGQQLEARNGGLLEVQIPANSAFVWDRTGIHVAEFARLWGFLKVGVSVSASGGASKRWKTVSDI